MSYKALYLTYRPKRFSEVAGQQAIVRTLNNAIKSEKIAHAYLFAGPRGTGKTSMARLFAKALNCEEGFGHECNKCHNCLDIMAGTHPDVIEIDAASNNGVEQVRDLIENVQYAPLRSRYKIYIIDEVHNMSDAAFNALLKTLEEPPENVIFILCTTEPYEIIPTILSRCQRFDFGKITEKDMRDRLLSVLKEEGVTYEEAGLKTLMRLADGGMRDALSILDQVLAYSGNSLKEKDVLDIYGLASTQEKISLLKAIREGNVSLVVEKSERFLAMGVDISRLVLDLIGILKDELIYIKTGSLSLLEDITKDEADYLRGFLSSSDCNALIDDLLEAQNNFKNVSDIRSLFELTLLKMASKHDLSVEKIPAKPTPVSPKAPEIRVEEPVKEDPLPFVEPPVIEEKVEPIPEPEPVKEEPEEDETIPPAFLFEDETEEAPASAPMPEPEPEPIKESLIPEVKDEPEPIVPEIKAEPEPIVPESPAPIEEPVKVEEAPHPEITIDTSSISHTEIYDEGNTIFISDDEIIKMIVLANKKERQELAKNLKSLESLKSDPKLGPLATLLCSGKPMVLCEEALLMSYDTARQAKIANISRNQIPLQELVESVLGRRVFVYGVGPKGEQNRGDLITKFQRLDQIGKLPKKNEIKLNLPK